MARVSVLVPTYNAAKYLDEAIQSVLSQTYKDWELIITDNQSTDNTEEVVSKYLQDQRISYYKNASNVGMGGNHNMCLLYARGEYLKFLCADDKLHPEVIERFVGIMQTRPSVSLVSSYFQSFGFNDKIASYNYKDEVLGKKVIRDNLLGVNMIGTPTQVMFRRNDLWVGTFRNEVRWGLDFDLWLRLLSIGNYYCVPEVLSYFREHEEQGTQILLKDFTYAFDSYSYLKNVQLTNQFDVNTFKDETNSKLKYYVKQIVSAFPRMLLEKRYDLMQRAIPIVLSEGLALWSFGYLTSFFIKSVLKKIGLKKLFKS